MSTIAALEAFRTTGLLHLQQAVGAEVLEPMVDRVWQLMAQQGLSRDDPGSWATVDAYFGIRGVQKLQHLRNESHGPEQVPVVRDALDQIFAGQRTRADHWGQALVTLPVMDADWLLPGNVWHFDHRCRRPGEISGVNVFLLMDDVLPGGGGTVVLRNAPLLMDAYLAQCQPDDDSLSAQNKRFLRFDPWLTGLKCDQTARSLKRNEIYMNTDTEVRGVPVRIVELTGGAGDVFVTHPALLHAPAMNVGSRPRLMRTQRIWASDQ